MARRRPSDPAGAIRDQCILLRIARNPSEASRSPIAARIGADCVGIGIAVAVGVATGETVTLAALHVPTNAALLASPLYEAIHR